MTYQSRYNIQDKNKTDWTCPHCNKKSKIPAVKSAKWIYVFMFILLGGNLYFYYLYTHSTKPEVPAVNKKPLTDTISKEVISYINSDKADMSCDLCLKAANRNIEEKHMTLRMKKIGNMVLIPEGEYIIGSEPGIGDLDEMPRHEIYLDAYYIDKHEVTNIRYMEFVNAVGKHHPVWMKPASRYNIETGSIKHYCKLGKALKADNNPVIGVTWYDAASYCRWLSKRLPSEAEWETAARGGTNTAYYYGEDDSSIDHYAWYELNSKQHTRPVEHKKPNNYGIYDMQGNVWEWINDFYKRDYYSSSPKYNPKGPKRGTDKVIRGGSWAFESEYGRVANRAKYGPFKANDDIGFRCVISKAKLNKIIK